MSNPILKGKKFSKLLLSCIFLIASVVNAQSQVVSGTVRSGSDNQPLTGVTIQEKGSSNATATDSKGHYLLRNISPSDSLFFSYIGFKEETVPVNGRQEINIGLQVEASSLDQVVVIGYGTQKKSDLTGAVARVDAESFKSQPMTQVTDMLTGTVAGINVNQGTSADGSNSFLQIRGRTSLNASTVPMIVVDDAIYNGDISDINPYDVKSIDILKDASASAIYGARASNGVIIITTKKGASGKPIISFSTKLGVADVLPNDFKPFDATGYLKYKEDLLKGWGTPFADYYYSNPNALPNGVTIDQWRNASANPQTDNTLEWLSRLRFFPTEKSNYVAGKSVNWYDKVMKPGLRQTYDLSVSGGSDKFKYYWSGGYDNNKGIILGDKFSTIRTRLNLDFKVVNWLNIGMNSEFSYRNQSAVPANLDGMFTSSPYGSEFDSTGNAKWYPGDYEGGVNPLVNYYGQNRLNGTSNLFASLYANIHLPLGFDYKLSFQPHYQFGHDYNFWPSNTTIIGGQDHPNGYGSRLENSQYEWILDNILHWKKQVGIHDFDLTLLYSTEQHQDWNTLVTNENFSPNQNLGFNALQFGINPSVTNTDSKSTGDGLMARLNYSLLNKYLVTLSIRRDGYSAFGQENPRANFPAAAIAWKISDENFFKVSWINNMKLRFSWGVNGNRDIGAYAALAQVSPNLYYNGSNTVVGVFNSSLANPNLKWERTRTNNLGMDLGFLKNRISIEANYYQMRTTDLLMNRVLPTVTGFANITSNLGEVDNNGFELTLNSINVNKSKFSWRSNFVFSLNRNKIKSLFGDFKEVTINGKTVKQEVPDYTNKWFPGEAIDRVWDYNVTGIWQVSEKTAAAVYNMLPGDFKSQDVNKDGTYQALDDKKFIGYTQPRYRLGLRNEFTLFNNFLVSFFIRADLGQISPFPEALHGGSDTYDRRSTNAIPYWTPDNPINDYSRLLVSTNSYGGGLMIYKPSSFVRIQDITLSYNLPKNIIQQAKFNSMQVFGSVRNLYTFSKWPGWDPESLNTPMPRIFTIGLTFSL